MVQVPRGEKLNMLVQGELGTIIDREIEFPESTLVTITHVVTSPDLRYATIFISVFGGSVKRILEMLEKNVYHIQQQLNKALRMRPVPRIRFALDEEEARRQSVEHSLAQLKQKGEL